MTRDIFDQERLPPSLDAFLRDTNPWWEGKPGPVIPEYRRVVFDSALRKLHGGLAPIIVVRGPRQVGKTTLQQQIIAHLQAKEGVSPNHILRVQFDEIPSLKTLAEPVLSIARWFENRVLARPFNECAKAGQPVYVFLDEVQNLADWAPQLKALVDHHTVKVLVTGSSALRIEAGRDSLAGRIASIDMGTLLLREIAELRFGARVSSCMDGNGLEPLLDRKFWAQVQARGREVRDVRDAAFSAFSERGGYPMAQARPEVPWPGVADQLNETVVQRAIQHDLRMGTRGRYRDPHLLEEVFRLACRYAGQSPSKAVFAAQIQQALNANVGWQRITSYLSFLERALLIKLARPLELRLKRTKGHSKLCLCDHSLRASWLQEVVPISMQGLERSPHLCDIAGHLAESTAGVFPGGASPP